MQARALKLANFYEKRNGWFIEMVQTDWFHQYELQNLFSAFGVVRNDFFGEDV